MDVSNVQHFKDIINPKLPQDYEVKCLIAEGTMGTIYQAVNRLTGAFLAIKSVQTNGNQNLTARIIHEFNIQIKLKHSNIGQVFGYIETSIYTIIFMELLTGGDLFDLIPVGKGINMLKGYRIYSDLLSAIEFCHSLKIVHMDIKPENVMISSSGKPKLIDFGLAVDHNRVAFIQGHLGTIAYSAPETFTKHQYKGYKADLFSLNITFLTLVTGERCWHKARIDDIYYRDWFDQRWTLDVFKRIPADLLNFLILALAHDPDKRLSIEQIKEHLWFKSATKSRMKVLKSPTKNPAIKEVPTSQPLIQNVEGLFSSYDIPMSQPVDLSNILMPAVENDEQIVKRMTRFFSKKPAAETLQVLVTIVLQRQHCNILNYSPNCVTVECLSSGFNVTFRIFIYVFGGGILVDFRRIKGDGLLFRNIFVDIRKAMVLQELVTTDNDYLRKVQPVA